METLYKTEVAPLTVLPFKRSIFSYAAEKNNPIGTVVRIPFSGRNLLGVVVENPVILPGKKPTWLKSLIATDAPQRLTEKQVLLAKHISEENFTPLGKVLKMMVPKVVKERAKKSTKDSSLYTNTTSLSSLTKETTTLLDQKKSLTFIQSKAGINPTDELVALIAYTAKLYNGQILVLVPEIIALTLLEEKLKVILPGVNAVALHSHLASGPYYSAWQKIQTNEAKIILATRHGIFAPFCNLNLVIQFDPVSESYKQWDMSPRYQTNTVLPVIAKLYQAKRIEYGALPPLSTLSLQKTDKKNILSVPLVTPLIHPEYINLRTERFEKNFSALSKPLTEAIQAALTKKEQAILFVHQGGLESFSVCKECKTLFTCPSCQSPLRLTQEDRYMCKRCGFKSSLFPSCPSCQGITFRSVGFGTEKVVREVKKQFPGATVLLADKSVFTNNKNQENFLKNLTESSPDIVVCTEGFLRFSPLRSLSLVAIIDADSLLSFPGIERDERFLQLLYKGLLLLPGVSERVLIQTFHPESTLLRAARDLAPTEILTDTLEERKLLSYPPFTRGMHISERKRKKGTEEALKKLFHLLEKENYKVTFVTKETKRGPVRHIALRYNSPLPSTLTDILTEFADTTTIDHDPLSLF